MKIYLDFDGVVADTVKIKNDAFLKYFCKRFPSFKLEIINNFLIENKYKSRKEKIDLFFKQIIKKRLSKKKLEYEIYLIEKYFKKIILKAKLFKNIINFIKKRKEYRFHIISAGNKYEIEAFLKKNKLHKNILSIHGYEKNKIDHFKNIKKRFNYKKKDIIAIGDSKTDYLVSKKFNIKFYFYASGDFNYKKYKNVINVNQKIKL